MLMLPICTLLTRMIKILNNIVDPNDLLVMKRQEMKCLVNRYFIKIISLWSIFTVHLNG